MGFWQGLCNVAKKVWNFAKPVVNAITGGVLQQAGSAISGEPDLSALNSQKQQLNDKISGMEEKYESLERDFQTRQNAFAEKQRKLDATAERLLREQESLRRAELELEDRQRKPVQTQQVALREYNDGNAEEQVAIVRQQLSRELERYERSQEALIKSQKESARDYAEHRKRLEEAYKVLVQNQSQIMNLIKTLPAIQKVKELHALTDNFMHNCKVFAEEPDAMVDETRIMQRKYSLKVMEVRNAMREGHIFPGSMRIWADAAMLDLHMLGFLVTRDVFSYRTVEIAKDLYHGYWDELKVAHARHRPVGEGSDNIMEIQSLLGSHYQSFDRLLIQSMPAKALPRSLRPTDDSYRSPFDRDGNAYGADDCHFDREVSSRRSLSLRGESSRLSTFHGGELVRVGDAPRSWKRDRITNLEDELASLRMEIDRRDGQLWENDRHSYDERRQPGSSSKMQAKASSSRSADEKGRRKKQLHSSDNYEQRSSVKSSRKRHESSDFQDPGRKHSSKSSKQKYQERHSSPEDQDTSSEESSSSSDDESSSQDVSSEESSASTDEEVNYQRGHVDKQTSHNRRHCHRAKKEQKDEKSDLSDGSDDEKLAKKKSVKSHHKSRGKKDSGERHRVIKDKDQKSVNREDGKKKKSHKKKHSSSS